MIRRWLIDAADRLEAAAELARELQATTGLNIDRIRVRADFLAERLWETAQRIGILQSLGPDPRAQLALRFCDLFRVARRAHVMAVAEGHGGLSEGFDAIASELRALLVELAAFDDAATELQIEPPTQALAGASR